MKKNIYKLIYVLFTSLFLLVASVDIAQAYTQDPSTLEKWLNGYLNPNMINQTNLYKPYLDDKTGSQELIDPQTGALILKQNDITLPGNDGLDFSLTRIYNSSAAEAPEKTVRVESITNDEPTTETQYFVKRLVYIPHSA